MFLTGSGCLNSLFCFSWILNWRLYFIISLLYCICIVLLDIDCDSSRVRSLFWLLLWDSQNGVLIYKYKVEDESGRESSLFNVNILFCTWCQNLRCYCCWNKNTIFCFFFLFKKLGNHSLTWMNYTFNISTCHSFRLRPKLFRNPVNA